MSFLGIDIGTGSSKAVIVDEVGTVLATARRTHHTSSPKPRWFEHDADQVWWAETLELIAQLGERTALAQVDAIGVSGIGPVVLIADEAGRPLRRAILYGIDTRAQDEIVALTEALGEQQLLAHAGNRPSSQSIGPKLMWLATHEPDRFARARRWYASSSYVVARMTGEYVLDHYTASASDPLYDLHTRDWWDTGWQHTACSLTRPRLAWPDEVVGTLLPGIAQQTGLRADTPVIAGTIDALAEAYSAGCREVGDTMVMYGSTLFLIEIVAQATSHPGLWAVGGRTPDSYSLAAGMATAGLITTWLAELVGQPVKELLAHVHEVTPGSDGLVLLPYFAGERTPLFDPQARGCWLGLTLGHTRAHLARSALEGVAFGVRHNIETMAEAGAPPKRLVAVGGGTQGELWTGIVSDITGLPQDVPSITIGASFGDARMAADALGVDTHGWNPIARRLEPNPDTADTYDQLYGVYRRTYRALREDMHLLAGIGE